MQPFRRALLITLLAAGNGAAINAQSTTNDTLRLTLTDAWHRADTASRAIRIRRHNTMIASSEVKDLKMERFPEVGIAGSMEKATNIPIYDKGLLKPPSQHEVIHTLYRVGTDFNLNIYNGNKLNLSIASAGVEKDIADIQEDESISTAYKDVAALYLELQKSFEYRQLVQDAILERKEQLREINDFFTHGIKLKNDVLRVELEVSRQEQLLLEINNDITLLSQRMNILIGLPDDYPLKPASENLYEMPSIPMYEDCLAQAAQHAFPLLISAKETTLSELNLKKVKANTSVKLNMYGEFYYANPQIFLYPYNPYWYSLGIAGVKASLPLSAFYHNIHKVGKAKIELEKEEEKHKDTEDRLRKDVKEGYLRYKEAVERLDVTEVNVARAEENARIVRNSYFNQAVLITELLDAELQLLQAKFDKVAAAVTAKNKYYQLENSMGILTEL